MANFNPEEHDNVINPYKLSAEKQREVMQKVDDDRLTNPPGDYFKLELESEVIDIPKLEYIGIKTKAGKISRTTIIDYIKQQLERN